MPVSQGLERELRTYYVVFQKSSSHRPWHFWTWNGYEHCWVFFAKYKGPAGLLTRKHTIKVEPLSAFIDIDYWEADPEEVAAEFLKEEHILDIVRISLLLPTTTNYKLRGLINCVTVVKTVMSLGEWFILTPQQLRRYLLRKGGKSLKQAEN